MANATPPTAFCRSIILKRCQWLQQFARSMILGQKMDRCDYDSKQNFMYVPFQPTIKRCYADGNQKTNQFLLHLYQSQILQSLVSGLSSGLRMMFKLNVSLFPVLASSAAPLMGFISIFPALCTPF